MDKKFIHDDVVEFHLRKNPNLKLSIKKLTKILKISPSEAYYLAMNSKNIRIVDPLEVGSHKHKVFVFTYCKNNPKRQDLKKNLKRFNR